MEVKPGYKQTEVGVIPEDWDVKRLREISPTQSVGLVINPSSYFEANGEVPMLVGSCISENKINAEKASRISSKNSERLSACRLKTGDLVTVRVGFPGTTAVVPTELDGCNCASMMIIRSHKSFDSYWLAQLLNSPIGRAQIENVEYGTAQKQFNISDAIDFIFPVPPPAEQSKIAEAAKSFDEYIESLEQKIDKKRGIKQAAMQELLTGKRRLPGFEGEWVVKRLCEISTIAMGRTPSRTNQEYWGRGHTWLSIADLKSKIVTDSKEEITDSAASIMSVIPKGTLLMSFKLSIGKLCFAGRDLFTNEAICSFNALDASSEFLYYALGRTDFSLYGKQAVKGYTLNKESLQAVEVCLPSREEQDAIASVLSSIDEEILNLEERREKALSIKQGMMQQLLTGKIRLT